MDLLPLRALGVLIMVLFTLQGVFTLFSPGSLRFQRPEGGFNAWIYNVINLTTILVLTPLAGLSLLKAWPLLAWTGFAVPRGVGIGLDVAGLVGLGAGNLLLYWSRIVMGRSFRLGAVPPGAEDRLIESGPFAMIRHPMYTAVLLMAVGLGLLLRSWVFLGAFVGLLVTILPMMPVEERQLKQHYGEAYAGYCGRTWRLIPYLY